MSWACQKCGRRFLRVNQRHACGTGSGEMLLRDRSKSLANLYRRLERTVRAFGEVEVVTRNRYALFRTTRIFADLTVTRHALRVVVHLPRRVNDPCFLKAGPSGKRVSHVAFVATQRDLRAIMPYVREAYELTAGEA